MKLLTEINFEEVNKAMYIDPIIYEVKGIPDLNYWNRIYNIPICFIESVSSENSCVGKINETIFGLSCSIYSSDIKKIE